MGSYKTKGKTKSRTKTGTRRKARTKQKSGARHSLGSAAGVIAAAVILVLLIAGYCTAGFYFSKHFLPGTTINGVDVSLMTIDQAREAVLDGTKNYRLTLIEQDFNKEVINGSDIALEQSISPSFDSLLDLSYGMSWALGILEKNDVILSEEMIEHTYDDELLTGVIDELECVDPQYPIAVKNAEIIFSDGAFVISPESAGNVAHRDELDVAVRDAIEKQKDSINLEEEGIYDMPEVCADDPDLLAQKALYDELNDLVITLKFGDKSVPIDVKTISGWVKAEKQGDGSYKLGLNDKPIKEYVKNLAKTYDTYDKTKFFTSHAGNVVEINSGDYGYMLDQEYTVDELKKLVLAKKSVTKDLTDNSEEMNKWWYRKAVAYDSEGSGYYGNTYAEVSITEQHMWLYQNGTVTLETDVVTGNPNLGNATPMGAFRIRYHQAPATLRGPGYVTQVAYWMVFADDVGFHDATWQPYFGGNLYLSNGSHGCVNMPIDKAGQLYELIYDGMPVFVY